MPTSVVTFSSVRSLRYNVGLIKYSFVPTFYITKINIRYLKTCHLNCTSPLFNKECKRRRRPILNVSTSSSYFVFLSETLLMTFGYRCLSRYLLLHCVQDNIDLKMFYHDPFESSF